MSQALRQTGLSASAHHNFGQRNAEFRKNPRQQIKFTWEVMREDRLGMVAGEDIETGLFEHIEHATAHTRGAQDRQAEAGKPRTPALPEIFAKILARRG